jgi:hypothetical protein
MTHCKNHPDHKSTANCKICLEPYCHTCTSQRLFLCEGCFYKVLIMLLIAMIVISYAAWFGIIG